MHIEAARVSFLAILRVHQLANHLRHVLCVHFVVVSAGLYGQFFIFGSCRLACGDKAVFLHAVDDVQLPRARPFWVSDGVVGRRCFGQPGQHGSLSNVDITQWLAKISFRCCGKTVSPVAQKYLIHVNFKNLIFA